MTTVTGARTALGRNSDSNIYSDRVSKGDSSRGTDSNGDSSSGVETAMEIAAVTETATVTAAVGQRQRWR